MAGCRSRFLCVLFDQDRVEFHKHTNKERGQYPAILTNQAWSIKDLLHGQKNTKTFASASSEIKIRAGDKRW